MSARKKLRVITHQGITLEEVEKGTGVFYIKDESGKVVGYYDEYKYKPHPTDDSFVRPTYDLPIKRDCVGGAGGLKISQIIINELAQPEKESE